MGTCVLREKANVIGDSNGVVYDPFIEQISIKDCVPDSYLQHHQEACCYVADTVCVHRSVMSSGWRPHGL